MEKKRYSDYQWLMNRLPVDLRPALATEKKWFERNQLSLGAGIHGRVANRLPTDKPSQVLQGLFSWHMSSAGPTFWFDAFDRLRMAELHKEKEAARLAPIRAEAARRRRRRLVNKRLKTMQRMQGYKK